MPEDWTLLEFSKTAATAGRDLCRFRRTVQKKKKKEDILFEHRQKSGKQIL